MCHLWPWAAPSDRPLSLCEREISVFSVQLLIRLPSPGLVRDGLDPGILLTDRQPQIIRS